jgi:hypothetical protein
MLVVLVEILLVLVAMLAAFVAPVLAIDVDRTPDIS